VYPDGNGTFRTFGPFLVTPTALEGSGSATYQQRNGAFEVLKELLISTFTDDNSLSKAST